MHSDPGLDLLAGNPPGIGIHFNKAMQLLYRRKIGLLLPPLLQINYIRQLKLIEKNGYNTPIPLGRCNLLTAQLGDVQIRTGASLPLESLTGSLHKG